MPVLSSVKSALPRAREKRPFLDHLVRAVQRYLADAGDRLAAAVTFYWFLSLFPILLLAVAALGFVYGDEAPLRVQDALGSVLPATATKTIGDVLVEAKGPAGVVGLVGLLFSGLGWIDALREAIRSMWHQNVTAGNLVVRKLVDVVVLVGLFATIAASIVVTGAATAATDYVLELVGVSETTASKFFVSVLTYVLAGVADTALFVYLFTRLPRVVTPIRRVLKGALLGAVGFAVLKFLGGFYIARTTSKGEATYGAFAVVVGLLLFLNVVSRFLLLTAAFVVTAPYDSDVAPSGTADPESARKAGIPQEFVSDDPDDPPNLREEGAPSPLQAAVQGRTAPQDEQAGKGSDTGGASTGAASTSNSTAATGTERSWSRRSRADEAAAVPAERSTSALPSVLTGSGVATRAAQAGVGVLAVAVLGVLVHALRTVVRVLRR